MAQKLIYQGQEWQGPVSLFFLMHVGFDANTSKGESCFCWQWQIGLSFNGITSHYVYYILHTVKVLKGTPITTYHIVIASASASATHTMLTLQKANKKLEYQLPMN